LTHTEGNRVYNRQNRRAAIAEPPPGERKMHTMRIVCRRSRSPIVALGLLLLLLVGESAWGAIAIDAIASTDRTTASATVASPTLSTVSGGELLLAFISTDYISGANTTVRSVAGAGLTWALV